MISFTLSKSELRILATKVTMTIKTFFKNGKIHNVYIATEKKACFKHRNLAVWV